MFCTKCGNEVNETSMFCPHCGNNLKEVSTNDYQNQIQSVSNNTQSNKIEPLCLVGFIFGFANILFMCIPSLIGLILSIVGYTKAKKDINLEKSKVFGVFGIVLNAIFLLLLVIGGIVYIAFLYHAFKNSVY